MWNQQAPDSINTRVVLIAYAIASVSTGIVFPGWTTALLLSAACCALGLARIEDAVTRRHAVGWFAAAHCAVFLVTLLPQPGIAEWTRHFLFLSTIALWYTWMKAAGDPDRSAILSIFGPAAAPKTSHPAWEQQIRASAALEERNRLARDLHDSVKQQLFVIQTAAATAQARFTGSEPDATLALTQVRDSAREAMAEMEAMVDNLTASPLENSGLVAAMKKQCEAFGFRTGARVNLSIGDLPDDRSLPPGAQLAVFRVAQEALSNIARHARATRVEVSLQSLRSRLELKISDDGTGYLQNQTSTGMGIRNMQSRADEFGGTVEISSKPASGTSVRFAIPAKALTPGIYRSRVLWNAAVVAVWGVAMFRNGRSGFAVAFTLSAMEMIRYSVAWHRTRHA